MKINIQHGVQVVLMNATTQLSNIAYYSNNQDKIYDNDWPRTIDGEISEIADKYYQQISIDPNNALDWNAFTVDDLFMLGFYRHIIDKDGMTVWMIPAYLYGIIYILGLLFCAFYMELFQKVFVCMSCHMMKKPKPLVLMTMAYLFVEVKFHSK